MKKIFSKVVDLFLYEPEHTDEYVLILRSFVKWGNDASTDPTAR